MITANNVTGTVPLFTASNGMTSWWNLRLAVAVNTGTGGAVVTLKVNGQDIPSQNGGFSAQVDPSSYPQRTFADDVLLNDGDVVTADIQGPTTVNISLSGEVCSEQL
jgi:hypothetical protein